MYDFHQGHGWPQWLIDAVWSKGQPIQGWDPNSWRHDCYGVLMHYGDYGNRNSDFGWEIDHIIPKSRGGTSELSNLQPLNWMSNVKKGDQ